MVVPSFSPAGLQRTTREKFRRRHSPSAFALQFQNPQRVLAAADNDAGFVRRQNFPCRAGPFNDFRLPNFDHLRFVASRFLQRGTDVAAPSCLEKRERAGPGREGAQPVPNHPRRLAPVYAAVFLFDFWPRSSRLRRVAAPVGFCRQRNREWSAASSSAPSCASRSCSVAESSSGPDGRAALRDNGAGVEPGVHFHDGDAGLGVAIGNRPLNRRRAAIFRQQRRVNVQAAVARQIQDRRRQNLSVSHHDDEVGLQCAAVRR